MNLPITFLCQNNVLIADDNQSIPIQDVSPKIVLFWSPKFYSPFRSWKSSEINCCLFKLKIWNENIYDGPFILSENNSNEIIAHFMQHLILLYVFTFQKIPKKLQIIFKLIFCYCLEDCSVIVRNPLENQRLADWTVKSLIC